ncbi:hypothetical protein MRZ76_00130 [bacterium]|nr:hypothetical protein [bacterium]
MAPRKIKTRTALMTGLLGLCCLSLFGIGFSVWNIVNDDPMPGSGEIKADADGEFITSINDCIEINCTSNPVLGRYRFETDSSTSLTADLTYSFKTIESKMPSFMKNGSSFSLRCTFGVYDVSASAYLNVMADPTSQNNYASLTGVAWGGNQIDPLSYSGNGEYAYFLMDFSVPSANAESTSSLSFHFNNSLVLGVNAYLKANSSHSLSDLRYRMRFSFGGVSS